MSGANAVRSSARPSGNPGDPVRLGRQTEGMSSEITRINPSQLHPTPGYHHVTVVEAGRTAFLAGQCPLDPSGTLVGPEDLDAQIDQVAANAIAALSAVGAEPDQVVRSVIYVVSTDGAVLGAAWQRLNGSVLGPAFTAASTLLGVAQLGFPGQLIEVDLTAALAG
jgi:enamine deaminase RidA (YjgF/YER057c/UK114 family)